MSGHRSYICKQNSVNYLCVTVDKHLRWHPHVDKVRRLCLGKIVAIRRASAYLPPHICRTLYLSFVLPNLEYCSVVWDRCGAAITCKLEHVQNYALRVILKKPAGSNTVEMRNQLNLPSLARRRETSTLLQVRRCLSNLAPDYLSSKFTTRATNFSNYPSTRGAHHLYLKPPHTNQYKSSFEYFGAKLYNELPNHLKTITSVSAFRRALLKQ